MKLIHTSNFSFKEFFEPHVPPYAILSHTWTDDEVSYQEYLAARPDESWQNQVPTRAGFRKIVEACRAARDAGLCYLWIDTCCIDKANSSELSEALNYMFRWYGGSTVCYVYLDDAVASRMQQDPELIAPPHIIFYDVSWRQIGTKQDFALQLSHVTKIDVEVLQGSRRLESVLVAKRMSWASRRQTTRLEDKAYCLMGIFDVNMPMLYGEGHKAFLRLQREIFEATQDISIFTWDPDEGCHSSYLPMFAPYIELFAPCADTVSVEEESYQGAGAAILGPTLFTVTKTHIQATFLSLGVVRNPDDGSFCYLLQSRCTRTGDTRLGQVFLNKVGAGLFVRVRRHHRVLKSECRFFTEDIVDMYLDPGQILFSAFDKNWAWGIKFQYSSAGNICRLETVDRMPVVRWDTARQICLVQDSSFVPDEMEPATGTFVVACVVRRVVEGQEDRPFTTVHHGVEAMTFLVTTDVWDCNFATSLPRQISQLFQKKIETLQWDDDRKCQFLDLEDHRIRVVVRPATLEREPIFKVEIHSTPW